MFRLLIMYLNSILKGLISTICGWLISRLEDYAILFVQSFIVRFCFCLKLNSVCG